MNYNLTTTYVTLMADNKFTIIGIPTRYYLLYLINNNTNIYTINETYVEHILYVIYNSTIVYLNVIRRIMYIYNDINTILN